ncbi:dnaJ-related protein SCJ1-like [Zingiber officinale]|uniref:dnaJ-related protein SCJ1-like n=1 Tax=Zingiber officinale TaxID=94328 RepID=UPI001C4AB50B|nr:dnaJ-related protein SCJ1-like [Zingiber officinale]
MIFQDYYKILEVDYDATEEAIRSNFIRMALSVPAHKPSKLTPNFTVLVSKIWTVLSDPVKRREYDEKGVLIIQDFNAIEYLKRHKGLILTCNGPGIRSPLR